MIFVAKTNCLNYVLNDCVTRYLLLATYNVFYLLTSLNDCMFLVPENVLNQQREKQIKLKLKEIQALNAPIAKLQISYTIKWWSVSLFQGPHLKILNLPTYSGFIFLQNMIN